MSDVDNTIVTKICTKCNEEKIITEFHKSKKSKDGHITQCRKCKNSIISDWIKENKERQSASNKSWHEANKERISARHKDWYAVNKERACAYSKEWAKENNKRKKSTNEVWRNSNKERQRELNKVWRVANQEKSIVYARNRRARKRNAPGTHTSDDIQNLLNLQKSKCAICNKSISEGYHVDHIIALVNGGSNDKYNLQLLCVNCNCTKTDKDPIDFMQSRGKLL